MLIVELFEVGGNFASPLGFGIDLIAGLPTEDGGLIAVLNTRVDIFPGEQEVDRLFEVVDDLPVGPELVRGLAAKRGVLADAAPPLGLIDEGDNHANTLFSCDLHDLVECPKSFFAELAGPA